MKRDRQNPLFWSLVVSSVVCILYALFARSPFLEIPKLKTQDVLFSARRPITPQSPILKDFFLITIDDDSVEKICEKGPFKRHHYAELIRKISAAGPKAIGLDLIFSGKSDPLDDALLEQAIETSGKVILAAFVSSNQDYILSLSELNRAARGSGVVNKLIDRDHVVRRARLYYRDQTGKLVVAWAWEMELLFQLLNLHRNDCQVLASAIRCSQPSEQEKSVVFPLYSGSDSRINYRYVLADIPHMPLWKALKTESFASEFKDKVILVGSTSQVLHDYYRSPLGMMSGIMVNINTLISLMTQDHLKKLHVLLDLFILGVFVFIAAFLGFRLDILRGLTAMAVASAVLSGLFFVLFCFNYLADCFTPLASGWVVFLGIALYRYFHTFVENIQLQNEVVTDPLTGLFNRRVLEDRVLEELEELNCAKQLRKTDVVLNLCVMMIDIDDFKKINDQYGHQFGDEALKNVSFVLRANTRKEDLVARFGGEEFCIILPHTGKSETIQIAEKIRRQIASQNYNYVNCLVGFTVSIGIASAREDNLISFKALIRAADEALYEAKRAGKNRIVPYSTHIK